MLQPTRRTVTAMLGDRPAVLAIQAGQQPEHQRPGMPQRLAPGEPRRDPIQQRAEPIRPAVRIYPGSRGQRGVRCCLHNHR